MLGNVGPFPEHDPRLVPDDKTARQVISMICATERVGYVEASEAVFYAIRNQYPLHQWQHSLYQGGKERLILDAWVYATLYHGDKTGTWMFDGED